MEAWLLWVRAMMAAFALVANHVLENRVFTWRLAAQEFELLPVALNAPRRVLGAEPSDERLRLRRDSGFSPTCQQRLC